MSLTKICSYLKNMDSLAPGQIKELEGLLANCWHELTGGGDENMTGLKLRNRTEELTWEPPFLYFDIERHAQQSGGSIRATVHTWRVNVETGEASIIERNQRYIGGMAKALKVEPLAEEVAKLILSSNNEDPRIRWLDEKRVRIMMRKIIPKTNWRTTRGREMRFRKALEEIVRLQGWNWESSRELQRK